MRHKINKNGGVNPITLTPTLNVYGLNTQEDDRDQQTGQRSRYNYVLLIREKLWNQNHKQIENRKIKNDIPAQFKNGPKTLTSPKRIHRWQISTLEVPHRMLSVKCKLKQ